MKRFRIKKQTIWRTHSVLGLTAGLGLLVIGLTGSILMFSSEIDGLLRPDVVKTTPAPGGRLPFDTLVDKAASAHPDRFVRGWAINPDDASATDQVWVQEEGEEEWESFHVDPYTGRVLSGPEDSSSHFTGWLLELHYTFFADHIGMLAAGLFALMLFLLGLTGLWLYRDFWKHFLRFRWGKSARILFADLHRFIGITSVVFNLILGFTGAWWNLSHLIGHLGEEEHVEVAEGARLPRAQWASVSEMLGKAPEVIDGYSTRYISFPGPDSPEVKFFGNHIGAGPLRGIYGSTVTFNAATGRVMEHHDIREATTWEQVYDSFMPLHYGTFGGWPVKILWCLGGLTPGMLAVTGFVVWRRRQSVSPI